MLALWQVVAGDIMQAVGPPVAVLNVALLAAVFTRLGEITQRLKSVEWRLKEVERKRSSIIREV